MALKIVIEPPNPKQQAFFRARQKYIAYGGARGGGKSWALRRKILLLGVNYPGIRILLMRRTYPELRENHILPLQSELLGLAAYKDSDKSFSFVNGSRLVLGYCANDADVNQYQGHEYDIICIDEATNFSEYQFTALTACLRGVNDYPKRIYLTCNPGGVGHAWVKRLFIDKQYKPGENPEDYAFISAKVYDNKALLDSDPGYVGRLQNLPDKVREAWLNGNWDIFVGQYFSMWDRDLHVVSPFVLPGHWRRYVTMDYGRDMFACYFVAMDEQGRAYVYKEIYQSGLLVTEAAAALRAATTEQIDTYYAPPDLWNKHSDTGRSTADIFAEQGIYLVKANNDRVQGWYDLAEWLKPMADEQDQKTAGLRIFDNCANLIRTLPMLQYDERNPNDCAKEPHELTHAPDAIRYFVAGRPYGADMPRVEEDEDRLDYDSQLDNFLSFGGR